MKQNCNSILDSKFILSIIQKKKQLIKKFDKFKNRQEIEKIPNHIFCPYENCEGYAIRGSNKFLKCNKGHKFCSECKFKGWHKGTRCGNDEKRDMELFINWKNKNNVKSCPYCKAPIEKNEGCNHMTCINCKYEFCWLCNGKFEEGHFNNGHCRQFDREENNLPLNYLQIIERDEININFNDNNLRNNNQVNIYYNERNFNPINIYNNENRCCIFIMI